MSAIPSAEVVMERLRMALAEAGYPDVPLNHDGCHDVDGWPRVTSPTSAVRNPAVWWAANELVYPRRPCWACWIAASKWRRSEPAASCELGNCTHPNGPARPPRELLRAAS